MKRIVLVGASGHAKVVAEAIELSGLADIVGFIDSISPGRKGEAFCGSTILGGEEALDNLARSGIQGFVAVGANKVRLRLAEWMVEKGFVLATIIHPHASVSRRARVGAGSVVLPGVVIAADAQIGANVIVNSGACVDHDCVIEDGVHLSPGVHLGGGVKIEKGAWLGVGVSVRDHVTVGAMATVGVGAAVVSDIPAGITAVGVPARPIAQ